MTTAPNPSHHALIANHEPSGDIYILDLQCGRVIGVAGPYTQTQADAINMVPALAIALDQDRDDDDIAWADQQLWRPW